MSTVSDLVRHRVEAYNDVVAVARGGGGRHDVLVATDPLLGAGLVTILIRYVAERNSMVGRTPIIKLSNKIVVS